MHHVVQQADSVHQQINAITTLLEQFNARRSGLLREASRREEGAESECPGISSVEPLIAPHTHNSSVSALLPSKTRSILPQEVLDLIFGNLENEQLVLAARTNKSLYVVANRRLYHTIIISSDLPRSARCMRTLVQYRPLALLVRSFSIQWPAIYTPTWNLYDLVNRTLHSLPSITTLFIDVPNEFPQLQLDDCTFALQSLNASFRFDENLIRFLESQPTITDLSLRGFNSDPSQFSFSASTFNLNPSVPSPPLLSPTALPRLNRVNAIHAGPEIMRAVVTGRPVKTVVMPLYADSATKCLDALSATSTPIEKLSIMSFDPNAPKYILKEISERFPDLEALAIVLLLAVCSEEALEASAPYLARFERLRYITFMSALPMSGVSPEVENCIAKSWHSNCPSLTTIILPMGNVLYFENSTWSVLNELSS
ncbi:hypothetical protein PQX77_014908 [Marasmius sp. AFHP31]|nr:hypothetical protein PQX77_014908 [Marasmius sp. AFHP31]